MKILDLSKMDEVLTKELNQKADILIGNYQVFIDSIIEKHTKNVFLSFLPFLSRNKFLSNAFLNVSILFLAIDYVNKYKDIETIILPSKGIADSLSKYLRKEKNKKIRISYLNKKDSLFHILMRWTNSYIYYIKLWYNVNKYSQREYLFKEPFELIDTYVLSSSFADEKYLDRYFNDLEKYTDKNILFLVHPIINDKKTWKEFVYDIESCKTRNFLFKERFLTLKDILFISKMPFVHLFYCIEKKFFFNVNISSIINEDIKSTINSLNTIIGISCFLFIKNISRKKIPINSLIGWYEGQTSSIALFKAFRKFYKENYSLGYVGMPIFHNNYGVCPSVGQMKTKSSPEYIGVIGKIFKEYVLQCNPNVLVKEVPAFRYNNIFKIKNEDIRTESDVIMIFVVLVYDIQVSSDTIKMILTYIRKNKNKKFDIRMKNHPVFKNYTLSDYKIGKEDNLNNCSISFIEDDIVSYSRKMDIIILAGFSSALFELLLANKPILQREELGKLSSTRKVMDRYKNYFFSFYGEDEFCCVFDYLINKRKITFEREQVDINDMFIEPTIETVNQLFIK